MPLTVKVPVKEIKANKPVCETVEEKLKTDPANGYTVMGLMVECYNVKESEMDGRPFTEWRKGLPTLYSQIRRCLEKLQKQGKVDKWKKKQAYVYWWKA
jgi:hypothetical protein